MKRLPIIIIAALTAVLAASAFGAGITVFKTSFSSRAEYESIKSLSGPANKCKRDWRDQSALGVTVKGGPIECTVSTPVSSDAAQPDQLVRVVAKVNKDTDKKVRKTMYVGVVVRANRKESYELRVLPKPRRFQFLKSGEVLDDGRVDSIDGMATKNRLQIGVERSTVTAKVNGHVVATLKDKNADQVSGRQAGLSFGNNGKSKKGRGVAFFDKLKVQVPVP